MLSSSRLDAAIDPDSNSFHMLVIRKVVSSIQLLSRIKSAKCSWQPGWISKIAYCIRPCNAEAVLEAVLRTLAGQSTQANPQLPDPGDQRRGRSAADLLVAHTTGEPDRRLVVDIGGGSTEWVTGR